jgi:hypothetical protein
MEIVGGAMVAIGVGFFSVPIGVIVAGGLLILLGGLAA